MTKRFLFITDTLSSLDSQTDTSLALMSHAYKLGHEIFICEIKDIFLEHNLVFFKTRQIKNFNTYPDSLPVGGSKNHILGSSNFNIICMRKDPPVDNNFITALMMLRCHDSKKTTVFNNPDGLLCANEKLFGLSISPQFFPKTLVSQNKNILRDFFAAEKKVVIKPLFGAGGSGVLVFESQDKNFSAALEILTSNFSCPVIMQKYIEEAPKGDKRILLLGKEALGAVLRKPSLGDHRANFHAGGIACATNITQREQEIINFIGPKLFRLGLHFVGLDIIGGYLTEINITSPTCLLEIENYLDNSHKHELRDKIINYMIKHVD